MSRNLYRIMVQFLVVASVLLSLPLMIYVFTGDFDEAIRSLIGVGPAMTISFLVFLLNYWWFVPYFYYRKKKPLYFLFNFILYALILLWSVLGWWKSVSDPYFNIFILTTTLFITLMFLVGATALALALRNSLRSKILREEFLEEKRKHTEAELNWLKNQINPHFLFNTLNNISALVALDTDKAQDSISQLSDLLRYAMYETSKPYVPLVKEVDFMKDYISLMSLRCNSKTIVKTDFKVNSDTVKIAPLLLVSLIENSFKHGVSANARSNISISLKEEGGILEFESINSNHAKGDYDRSGSGIGLSNMKRRLDLLYKGKYEWLQESDNDLYKVNVKIML